MNDHLSTPWPYFGGKQWYAAEVWDQFGPVTRYIEPFFGSGAVLLRNPYELPKAGEVVCDKNPFIANFWRSIKGKGPDDEESAKAVAWWADYPTIHQDLRARHVWLLEWARDNAQRLWDDADFFDCKAAGWWAWGMSNWVGGGFCTGDLGQAPRDARPYIMGHPGGAGVSAQRLDLEPPDTRPHVMSHPGGQGIQMSNLSLPDKLPHVKKNPGGQGVQIQRLTLPDNRPYVCDTGYGQGVQIQTDRSNGLDAAPLDGSRLQPWMLELCRRLKRTVVLHRDWKSAVTNKMMMRENGKKSKWIIGIFLDPPYRLSQGNRSKNIYQSDYDGSASDDAAEESYRWAVENGNDERLRIAFCCRHGDFPLPDGWTSSIRKFPGVKDAKRREKHQDEVMFSPHCGQGRRLL